MSQQETSSTARPSLFPMAAGVSALLLVGILFGASLWLLAGIAAVLVVGLAWFLANSWTDAAVTTRNHLPAEVKIGTRLPVEITVTNQSRLPMLWLLAEDLVPRWSTSTERPTLQVDGDRVGVLMLWPEQSKQLRYSIQCHRRGYFQIGPTVIETGDLMGLFRRYRVGNQPEYVTVLPAVMPLSSYEIGSRRPIGEIRVRENIMDDPTRLRGIRRWQPGDPMRSVHWAATARTGVLHSKVYEPSSIAGATIVLDMHVDTMPDRNEPRRSDLAVTAAASIAAWLHESGEPFALATNGRDAADRIRTEGWTGDHRVRASAQASVMMINHSDRRRPVILKADRGPMHFQEMVRTLARLERTDALSLAELLVESESRLSNETTILVIFQKTTPEAVAALISLSRRGWAVAAMINTQDINDYSSAAGPLIACNIPTFHLSDDESLVDVCRAAVR